MGRTAGEEKEKIVLCRRISNCIGLSIPLSSPKKKHDKMCNSLDFQKIEVDGKLLGVLNYNLMIPVVDLRQESFLLRFFLGWIIIDG